MIWLAVITFAVSLLIVATALLVEWRRYRRLRRHFQQYRLANQQQLRRALLRRILGEHKNHDN